MTDDKVQQNLEKQEKINQSEASKAARFKPGYDPRRWLNGRGKKSPDQKKGEEILTAVIWEELSRELDGQTGKLTEQPETVDTLRVMVRNLIKKKPEVIAERIAGKVTEKHDVTSGGEKITTETMKPSEIAARVAALLKEKNDTNSN